MGIEKYFIDRKSRLKSCVALFLILLFVFGVLITVTCGLISVLTFVPIKVQEWQDTKSYIADKKRKAETEKDNTDKIPERTRQYGFFGSALLRSE